MFRTEKENAHVISYLIRVSLLEKLLNHNLSLFSRYSPNMFTLYIYLVSLIRSFYSIILRWYAGRYGIPDLI